MQITIKHELPLDDQGDGYGKLRLRCLDGDGNGWAQCWTDDGTPGGFIGPGDTQGHGLSAGLPWRVTRVKAGV